MRDHVGKCIQYEAEVNGQRAAAAAARDAVAGRPPGASRETPSPHSHSQLLCGRPPPPLCAAEAQLARGRSEWDATHPPRMSGMSCMHTGNHRGVFSILCIFGGPWAPPEIWTKCPA
eukprot:gene13082-biopygen16995